MYHRIAPPDSAGGGVAVSPAHFAEHIAAVCDHFQPLRLDALTEAVASGSLPRRSVAITFDDGYADNLTEAKPTLQRHGFPATVFVVSGYVGSGERFWWDELERICMEPKQLPDRLELRVAGKTRAWTIDGEGKRRHVYRELREAFGPLGRSERDELISEMRAWVGLAAPAAVETLSFDDLQHLADGGLVEIGAHTVTHPRLPALSPARQLEEIGRSKQQLEKLLDRDVRLFSYPFGAHDRRTTACARKAGLACACTTRDGAVTSASDLHRLPRLYVGDWSAEELVGRISARLL
jgi:peptidoglycan/xylan/chitin deacetylase (PgdA/CDA1 family)